MNDSEQACAIHILGDQDAGFTFLATQTWRGTGITVPVASSGPGSVFGRQASAEQIRRMGDAMLAGVRAVIGLNPSEIAIYQGAGSIVVARVHGDRCAQRLRDLLLVACDPATYIAEKEEELR